MPQADPHTYQLYGSEFSYYTGKARAYLAYKGIPFEEHLATREIYKRIILPRVGWPVVPVIITPDDLTLQDTSDIIDFLEQRFPQPSVYPITPRQGLAALLMELFGDEWLKIPAMHYRWNHNFEFILGEFGRMSQPDLPPEQQIEAGRKTSAPFRGSLPMLGVTEQTINAIEASYEALLQDLDRHFQRYGFLFGSRPSIGDFGLFGPLYAHLFRDPASGDLMRRIAPAVADWVERLRNPDPKSGSFLPDDDVPDTLVPVLQRLSKEYLPVLTHTIDATQEWLKQHPTEDIPRAIGMHAFTLEQGTPREVTGERAIFPFDQWMAQRALSFYQQLSSSGKQQAETLLQRIGAEDLITMNIQRPLKRENFKLVRAE